MVVMLGDTAPCLLLCAAPGRGGGLPIYEMKAAKTHQAHG